MSHPSEPLNQSLRQSKSQSKKKRGIKVSLTPSKRQNSFNQVPCDSSYDIISENNTRRVVELPTIQYRTSALAHPVTSNIPRVNFHYSTPSEVNSSQVGVENKHKQYGVELVQSNHLIATNNLPSSMTKYDNGQRLQQVKNEVLPSFNRVNQEKNKQKQHINVTQQVSKQAFWTLNPPQQQVASQKIQIRPEVYKIVSDIKEKTQKHSEKKKFKQERKVVHQFKEQKQIIHQSKLIRNQNKTDKSKIQKQVKDNKKIENQSKSNLIKNVQIKSTEKEVIQNKSDKKCSDTFMAQNKNITNTELKNKNRMQKLKLAESKLLDIIRICDQD